MNKIHESITGVILGFTVAILILSVIVLIPLNPIGVQEDTKDKDYKQIQSTLSECISYLPKANIYNYSIIEVIEPDNETSWKYYTKDFKLLKDVGTYKILGITSTDNIVYIRYLKNKVTLPGVVSHEFGHVIYNNILTETQKKEYYNLWVNETIKPGIEEAKESDGEGFAEAFREITGNKLEENQVPLNKENTDFFKKILVKPEYRKN